MDGLGVDVAQVIGLSLKVAFWSVCVSLPPAMAVAWYARSAEETATTIGVAVDSGLSGADAAARLAKDGPNALSVEKPPPGWQQFLAQYKSYMQIILVGAAIASMLIGEIATGIVVLLITALNALGGLRQQGKAESAMNALQSMLKTTARVRRDSTEVKIDADQVVVMRALIELEHCASALEMVA